MKAVGIITACIVFLTLCLVIVAQTVSLWAYSVEAGSLRAQVSRYQTDSKTFDAILEEIKKRCQCNEDSGRGHGRGDIPGAVRISPVPE